MNFNSKTKVLCRVYIESSPYNLSTIRNNYATEYINSNSSLENRIKHLCINGSNYSKYILLSYTELEEYRRYLEKLKEFNKKSKLLKEKFKLKINLLHDLIEENQNQLDLFLDLLEEDYKYVLITLSDKFFNLENSTLDCNKYINFKYKKTWFNINVKYIVSMEKISNKNTNQQLEDIYTRLLVDSSYKNLTNDFILYKMYEE